MENLFSCLTCISQITRFTQSMSLGQNVKITHKHIFVFANIIFSDINHFRYDNCSHLWKICTVISLESLKLPEMVKACPWDKMQKSHIMAYLLLEVHFFLTYKCIDTIIGYIHQIFGYLFYVHIPKLIMLEKACPWDKNSLFSFPDVKMHYFTKKKILFGFGHS